MADADIEAAADAAAMAGYQPHWGPAEPNGAPAGRASASSPVMTLIPISRLTPGTPIVGISPDEFNGAVCEMWCHDDGTWTAEVRIPAHQDG